MSKHRWSGWPGAYCLDCSAEDAMERAVALDWLDYDEQGIVLFDTLEHELKVTEANNNCPVERNNG